MRALFSDIEWLHKWYHGAEGKTPIDFESQALEKKVFTFVAPEEVGVGIGNRATLFLMVCGFGRTPF